MKSEDNHLKNQSFIREKVVKRGNFKRRVLWAIRMVLGGILFGLAACLVFVCLKPWLEVRIDPVQETTEEAIVLPGEEETTEEETTAEEETTEAETLPTTTEAIFSVEELIAQALERDLLTIEDVRRLDQLTTALVSECNRGIMTVSAAISDGEGGFLAGDAEVPGVLWMMTESEGLILVDYTRLAGGQQFFVKRYSGAVVMGSLKAADGLTGIAVIRVPRADLEAVGIFETDVLDLGLSYSTAAGQMVMMLGSPYGTMYSAMTGQIVYTENGWGDIDAERRMLYSDIDAIGGGFLVNLRGQVLGMTTAGVAESAPAGYTSYLAISDLRSTIENLANGRSIAYLGVRGVAVSAERSEEAGIPVGLYVSEVLQDGPAYASGIQSGDVIVAAGETVITGMKDLQMILNRTDPGQVVQITVMRQGKDSYAEQIYEVTAGAR